MTRLIVGAQHQIRFIPDDAVGFFFRRRRGQKRSRQHHDHAENPCDERAMIERVVVSEPFEFRQQRGENKSENHRHHGGERIRALPQNAQRENDGERRRDEKENRLDFFKQRRGRVREANRNPDACDQYKRAAPSPETNLLRFRCVAVQKFFVDVDGENR